MFPCKALSSTFSNQSNMHSQLLDESLLILTRDVDSAVFAVTSLCAFPIALKVNLKTVGNIRPTENLKLEAKLLEVRTSPRITHETFKTRSFRLHNQTVPQREDGRHHRFFAFKLGGYGERVLMVLFQHRTPPRNEEGEELMDVVKNVSNRFQTLVIMIPPPSHRSAALASLPAGYVSRNYDTTMLGGRRTKAVTIFEEDWQAVCKRRQRQPKRVRGGHKRGILSCGAWAAMPAREIRTLPTAAGG